MRVRLVRKLADVIDGVDISDYGVGDVLDLHSDEARLLIAEEWAISAGQPAHRRDVRRPSSPIQIAEAADSRRRSLVNQLRRVSEQIEHQGRQLTYRRRREDILLDELRDARAKTIEPYL